MKDCSSNFEGLVPDLFNHISLVWLLSTHQLDLASLEYGDDLKPLIDPRGLLFKHHDCYGLILHVVVCPTHPLELQMSDAHTRGVDVND